MPITPTVWTAIIAIGGILTQLFIAYLGRRQVEKQHALQEKVSHRTAATFIADKRQKWIDELRGDMAFHLALTQEIVWKWDALRSRESLRVQQEASGSKDEIKKELAESSLQSALDNFSKENGSRDREHQERHIRIMFRLNPEEKLHISLRDCLNQLRELLKDVQSFPPEIHHIVYKKTFEKIQETHDLTEKILKAEWQRVKQEVAHPEILMNSIPQPKSNK